ncbi:MAG: hypothetical protein JF612_05215, partial [Planctomycetia bacterium]|nr:hypothetical protein [Planctomycetia bacterium]
ACQQPLKIPAGPAAAVPAVKSAIAKPGVAQPAAKAAAPKAPGAAPRSAAQAPTASAADAFDEIGLQAAAPDTRPCPGCSEPMPLAAVICIKCGYNTRLGRRMETVRVGTESGPEGHGAVATDLLNKAAQSMDDDAREEVKKTNEGIPWWVYLIALCILITVAACMLLFYAKEQPSDEQKKGYFQPAKSVESALVDGRRRILFAGSA